MSKIANGLEQTFGLMFDNINPKQKLLDIGIGTGLSSRLFKQVGLQIYGLDGSSEMVDIAGDEVKADTFIQCDMRNLSFNQQFDSVLITGRSLAYVIDNKGIMDTLTGVHKSLKDKGIFVFGVFEANGIFDNFSDFEQIIEHNDKKIRRISKLKKNFDTGWTYDWFAKYIIEQNDEVSEFDDLTTLRAFTKDEILLFLKLTDFKIIEIIEEEKALTLITEKK